MSKYPYYGIGLIKVSKHLHFLVKIHFGSSVSCKCDIYFGWSLEIQAIYIKKGCDSLYGVKMSGMMLGDIMQNLYIWWNFSIFVPTLAELLKMKIKLAKIFVFEVL